MKDNKFMVGFLYMAFALFLYLMVNIVGGVNNIKYCKENGYNVYNIHKEQCLKINSSGEKEKEFNF